MPENCSILAGLDSSLDLTWPDGETETQENQNKLHTKWFV